MSKSKIGFFAVFSMAAGSMISSGIFILPSLAFKSAGPGVFISYLVAGIFTLTGVLSIIELATAMPKAGGAYYFIGRIYGPLLGTVMGFLSWFALMLKTAFAVVGLAGIIYIFTGFPFWLSSLSITLVFVCINLFGVHGAVKLEIGLVIFLLASLLLFILWGVPGLQLSRFEGILDNGINPILTTSSFVFVSFGGLIQIASMAEDIKRPGRTIPRAMIAATVIVSALYGLIVFVLVGSMDHSVLAQSLAPVADAASVNMGGWGYTLMTAAAGLAFVTTILAGILSASRFPVAFSRDGVLPSVVGKERKGTPVIAILITGIFVALVSLLEIELLAKAASGVIMSSYILAAIGVIILRKADLKNYKPSFKVPGYPYVSILTIALYVFLLFDMGLQGIEITIGFIGLALAVYFLYARKRISHDFALIHYLKKIVDDHFADKSLEDELRHIVSDRAGDLAIDSLSAADFIDIEGPLKLDELFKQLGGEIARKSALTEDQAKELLHQREGVFPTALNHFSAVPHIVIPGSGALHLWGVRVKNGVEYTASHKKVSAVFLLIGSEDVRESHLQLLSRIARSASDHNFSKNWLESENPMELIEI